MNEPSNFEDGSIYGCPNTPLDSPPFLPGTTMSSSLLCVCVCTVLFPGNMYVCLCVFRHASQIY